MSRPESRAWSEQDCRAFSAVADPCTQTGIGIIAREIHRAEGADIPSSARQQIQEDGTIVGLA